MDDYDAEEFYDVDAADDFLDAARPEAGKTRGQRSETARSR
jgi:hypothetical protein